MWDPDSYLGFVTLRSRPFYELIRRIEVRSPRRVVDLGCGPGNLTMALAERWPDAAIEAMDSSPEMVAAAKSRGIDARRGDVRDWVPQPGTGVVVCNAVLQWVPGHIDLMSSWARQLESGAWLAVQMPGNFAMPSHVLVRELAAEPKWRKTLGDVVLRGEGAIATPGEYAELLTDLGCTVDAWETTYIQQLSGIDPVLEWVSGTALRPIRAALEDDLWDEFRAQLAPRLRRAYPSRSDGTTWFPFRRVFVVARTR